jgi:hypothetical protein
MCHTLFSVRGKPIFTDSAAKVQTFCELTKENGGKIACTLQFSRRQ